MSRFAQLERRTSESSISLSLNLDGTGRSDVSTSVPFFDHLLTAFSKHSLIDLAVRSTGDTHIDIHHTVEDTAIVLGQAIKQALGDKSGISRFGDSTVPLDEALARAVVDISGRAFLVHDGEPAGFEFHLIGGHFTGSMIRHVFEAIANNKIPWPQGMECCGASKGTLTICWSYEPSSLQTDLSTKAEMYYEK